MDQLIDGYRRFRAQVWPDYKARFEHLALGQNPRAMVIACADSRVDPAMIFGAVPGELFVVRNIANLVPPYRPDHAYHGTSAAIEFGVRVLRVQEVIVLGHAQCGGVQALLRGAPPEAGDFVVPWIAIAQPARAKVLACTALEDAQEPCEREVVRLSLANLMTFPWIAERVATGELQLHGARFGIASGVLELMRPDGSFAPASAD
jgi:carbonic anhydrase